MKLRKELWFGFSLMAMILLAILFVMFQAVFTWATVPADAIDAGFGALQDAIKSAMPDGFVRSLLTDGLIAGVGAVIVFLPQILILFLFILVLESSGYMVRAAFLMDRLMATVGLSGRAFIPLLSSFACAVSAAEVSARAWMSAVSISSDRWRPIDASRLVAASPSAVSRRICSASCCRR